MRPLFIIGRGWLLLDSAIFGLFGLLLAVSPDAFVFRPWTEAYVEFFSPSGGEERRFLLVPLGATLLGSYVMTGLIAAIPLKRAERWAWWALACSFLAWFLLDTAMCIHHGVWFNVRQINLVALMVQGIPLAMTAPWIFSKDRIAVAD